MASTLVAEPSEPPAGFEFNPSAPEFVPTQSPTLIDELQLQMASPTGNNARRPSSRRQTWNGSPDASTTEEHSKRSRRKSSVRAGAATEPAAASPSRRRSSAASTGPRRSRSASQGGGGDEAAENQRRALARRSTSASEAPGQVATLVVKNLALDLKKEDVLKYLEEQGASPTDVEFHRDASGAFRGTAFVRYSSPGKAKSALEKLGTSPDLGGRKARVELQKSKGLFGRKSLEAELPQEELGVVREEIEHFLGDGQCLEVGLPSTFSVHQRKYAHSLAERHSLMHVTRQGDNGEKFVYLSKSRQNHDELSVGRKKALSSFDTFFVGEDAYPNISSFMGVELNLEETLRAAAGPKGMAKAAQAASFKKGMHKPAARKKAHSSSGASPAQSPLLQSHPYMLGANSVPVTPALGPLSDGIDMLPDSLPEGLKGAPGLSLEPPFVDASPHIASPMLAPGLPPPAGLGAEGMGPILAALAASGAASPASVAAAAAAALGAMPGGGSFESLPPSLAMMASYDTLAAAVAAAAAAANPAPAGQPPPLLEFGTSSPVSRPPGLELGSPSLHPSAHPLAAIWGDTGLEGLKDDRYDDQT